MRELRVASRLAAPPGTVWRVVSTWEGVNAELAPLLRMTRPAGLETLRAGRLGRSWLLLGGVLPIDFDDLEMAWVEPGRGFSERSTMAGAVAWHHDRSLADDGSGGCLLRDHVAFRPRVRLLGGLQAFAVEAVFRHRHRRLRARFGAG